MLKPNKLLGNRENMRLNDCFHVSGSPSPPYLGHSGGGSRTPL